MRTRPSALPGFTVLTSFLVHKNNKRHHTAAAAPTHHSSPALVGPQVRVQPSQTAEGCLELQSNINLPALLLPTSFVWALTTSNSWPAQEGPTAANGSRTAGKVSLLEPRGKQGQVACRRGQQFSITPLA